MKQWKLSGLLAILGVIAVLGFSPSTTEAVVSSCNFLTCTITCTTFFCEGTSGPDVICGNSLSQTISGGDGNDSICGGPGIDTLKGGYGDDYLNGGADGDFLLGGWGNDSLYGDSGDDTLQGGRCADNVLDGGTHSTGDTCRAGWGNNATEVITNCEFPVDVADQEGQDTDPKEGTTCNEGT